MKAWFVGTLVGLVAVGASALDVKLTVQEAVIDLGGQKAQVWSYNGSVPGTPIVAPVGDTLKVTVTNKLKVATSIHWHGLEVPNDQDGTMASIAPGQTFTYQFKLTAAGTYWYHSHTRPVLEQNDMGLYAPLIVKAPEDAKYSSDQTFALDDWDVDAQGLRRPGLGRGDMERLGRLETVNGKTGDAIPVVKVTQGELHKFRFINASTAAVHTLRLSKGQFRVTHTDGHPLVQPYTTNTLDLQPGERFDVEYAATEAPGTTVTLASNDRSLGLKIRLIYGPKTVATVASPFVPPAPRGFPGIFDKKPDATLVLDSTMSGSMDAGSMVWTINGKTFPDVPPLVAKVGQLVKLHFVNNDSHMGHSMDHPIHLHGTAFQVVAINGLAPPRETWKDTVAVPVRGTLDLAFVYQNPGDWMLHCHILDHEDGGMMTMVRVGR